MFNLRFVNKGTKLSRCAIPCVCKKSLLANILLSDTIYIKRLSNGFLYARFYCKYSSNYFLKDSIGNIY